MSEHQVERCMDEHLLGIEESYNHIKNILEIQRGIANATETKASVVWAGATVAIGVALPLGLNLGAGASWAIVLALGLYGIVTALVGVTYFPQRDINLVNWPPRIRQDYWELPPREFYKEISIHIENAAEVNEEILTKKGNVVRAMTLLTMGQMLFLLLWFWLLHWSVVG